MKMQKPTQVEYDTNKFPTVIFTSDVTWVPTVLDCKYEDDVKTIYPKYSDMDGFNVDDFYED